MSLMTDAVRQYGQQELLVIILLTLMHRVNDLLSGWPLM